MSRRPDAMRRYQMLLSQRDLVAELEGLIAAAWPSLTMLDVGGWRLRTARGFTRLANSVWPREVRTDMPVDVRLRNAERFYVSQGLAPCFQVGPTPAPRDLDRVLAARGYASTSPVDVRLARTDSVAGRASGATEAVRLLDEPAPRWLAAWARAGAADARRTEAAGAVFGRVPAASAYALLESAGSDVAVARGVVHGGWLGIDALAATAQLRSPAAGQALAAALARWGLRHGAAQAYLQVAPSGEALASAVAGRRAYGYRFRVLPYAVPR